MKTRLSHHMPAFVRTPHLPYKPNCTHDDLLATHEEVASVFLTECRVYEKVDGSNLGMCLWEDHPAVRTKSHILRKGFLGKTPAKNQYRSVFNWFHDHMDRFQKLADEFPLPPVVYGEWMYMSHGILYDNLPDLFIAFDIWDGSDFVEPDRSRSLLADCGFSTPPELYRGPVQSYGQLESLCNGDSEWVLSGDRRREGVYVKQGTDRFKMVRSDFVPGKYFEASDAGEMVRNRVSRG
jgi:atypical dual specificity phosphatase